MFDTFVLQKKYLRPNETPQDMFRRVATALSLPEGDKSESFKQKVFSILNEGRAIFGGRILFAASPEGDCRGLTMLNCFAMMPRDSLSEIFETLAESAKILAAGGGVGYNFSLLRPRGFPAGHRDGIASGPVSFIRVYDTMGATIQQGGSRRGAQMAILEDRHPDVFEFVDAKAEEGVLSTFNFSVGLSDAFLEAVKQGGSWELRFHDKVVKTVEAKELLLGIARGAWRNGEPGVIFLDAVNEKNPTPHLGDLRITNPCSEALLYEFEACNLGSVNLSAHFDEEREDVDYNKLEETIRVMVRALDNVYEVTFYPLTDCGDDRIKEACLKTRKLGLGFVGYHDLLLKMRIPYTESQEVARKLGSFLQEVAHDESKRLAEERGPFPAYESNAIVPEPRRNATCTCFAPTGSISMVLGVTSSIEPLFSRVYIKQALGEPVIVVPEGLLWLLRKHYPQKASEAESFLKEASPEDPEHLSRSFDKILGPDILRLAEAATEIPPKVHIDILAEFQGFVDQSISKTVNCPHDTTVAEIADLILYARQRGCKSVTFYRAGSRTSEILVAHAQRGKRPKRVYGFTERVKTPVGTLFMTVNSISERPYEVFLTIGKAGADIGADAEAIGRLISLCLRNGVPLEQIVDQLKGIAGSNTIGFGQRRVLSLPDAVASVLSSFLEETPKENTSLSGDFCPECGSFLVKTAGCSTCPNCGFSRCQ